MDFIEMYPNCLKENYSIISVPYTPIRFHGTKKWCEQNYDRIREQTKQMYIKELKKQKSIVPVDVVGGRMWHIEGTDTYSWSLKELLPKMETELAELFDKEFTYQN